MTEHDVNRARIAEEDHRREQAEEKAGRELLEWRWHWTLDADNPDTMKFAEYARLVERSRTVIFTDAHAYNLLLVGDDQQLGVAEARRRAHMSAEREVAAEAVAEARDIALTSAEKWHRSEVKEVEEEAVLHAREHGTSVAEEARRIALGRVEDEQAQQRANEETKEMHGALVAQIRLYLSTAQEHLHKAAVAAEGVSFTEQQRDYLAHSIDNVRRTVELLDQAVMGTAQPDWSSTLRIVAGGQ